jgi:hypothetical protein
MVHFSHERPQRIKSGACAIPRGGHVKSTDVKTLGGNYSMALSIVLLASVGCTRAGITKAHAHAMKPVPASVKSDSIGNTDTTSVTPKVWELTALAAHEGPSVAS